MGFITESLNLAENYFYAKEMSIYVHPVNKEKKYNNIFLKGKTYQHYRSRIEAKNEMLFSENQPSQVPYIIFF